MQCEKKCNENNLKSCTRDNKSDLKNNFSKFEKHF